MTTYLAAEISENHEADEEIKDGPVK